MLRVPVMSGSRKYCDCDARYLLGASYRYDQFRTTLLGPGSLQIESRDEC